MTITLEATDFADPKSHFAIKFLKIGLKIEVGSDQAIRQLRFSQLQVFPCNNRIHCKRYDI
jgi:hypothetical protein